jgi:hypothetical protein
LDGGGGLKGGGVAEGGAIVEDADAHVGMLLDVVSKTIEVRT